MDGKSVNNGFIRAIVFIAALLRRKPAKGGSRTPLKKNIRFVSNLQRLPYNSYTLLPGSFKVGFATVKQGCNIAPAINHKC